MQRILQIFIQIGRLLRPSPGLFLFFIAPLVGILLTGLTSPNGFFNPLTLLFYCVLYGGGAIIARELTLYWGKGWPTLLLLGAAFGVIEEGLRLKSFFDPHWKYLGQLATYGRLWDVNWVWSVQITLLHAVFSIAIPVLLVSLLFPNRTRERWAGPRALLLLIVLFVLFVVLGFLFLSSYHPPFLPYLATLVIAVVLILLARFLPHRITVTKNTDVMPPLRFGLIGFLGTLTLYLITWIVPTTLVPFWVAILLMLVLVLAIAYAILHMSGNGASWTGRHQIALISGALVFYILMAPVTEFTQRQLDPSGLTFVALVALGLLYLLNRRIRKREQKQQQLQQNVVV